MRFLGILDDNCDLNATALIEKAKASGAFGTIFWDGPVWDVTESEVQRGHKQRSLNLPFTQHLAERGMGSRIGEPFGNKDGFADIVKSLIRLRKEIGGQCANNQYEVIVAYRYIYEELANVDYDIKRATREHFDAAARKVHQRESVVSAYKRLEKIEEAANLLDENGLVRIRLDWRCGSKKRPRALNRGLLEEPTAGAQDDKKLPRDGIIEGIAYLYHIIPKAAWVDRICICFISLLVITGLRIGEILSLPAMRVQTEDETGRRYFVFYPEKGAPPQKKWLMTAGADLAQAMIDELLDLTQAPRQMAAWLQEHPGQVSIGGVDWSGEFIDIEQFCLPLGLVGSAEQFFSVRVPLIRSEEGLSVERDILIKALRAESYDRPVNVVRNSGEKLELKDALACSYRNAFHSGRPTLRYAVVPVSEQQINDFIGTRAGQPAAFERYGIVGPDGAALNVSSHAFRHWLNDLLDRGGLSDVEQAVYFGRRNPKDNRAYQHMTPGERVTKARDDLKGGSLLGPVAELLAKTPVDRKDIVLAARIRAVHVVPGGACFHEFSQSPCPNFMACSDGCGDFHWQTDDPIQTQELNFQREVLEVAVESAKREVAEETWGADAWLQHNIRKLGQVNCSLANCRTEKTQADA